MKRPSDVARIRTIKPEFFRSRSLARCSIPARLTFEGLWCEADDHGHGIADARILKGCIWPLDDEIEHVHVEKHLLELEETGHVLLYEIGGERYYEIVRWTENQAPAYRRGDAKHPAPDGIIPHDDACKEVQDATESVLEGIGKEGKGSGSTRKRAAQLPDDWEPSEATKDWMRSEYPAYAKRGVIEAFKDYCASRAKTYVDPDRALKNWVRNEAKWHPAPETKGPARTFL